MNDLHGFEVQEGQTENDRYFTGLIEKQRLTDKLDYYGFQLKCTNDFAINLQSEKVCSLYLCINLADRSILDINCGNFTITVPSFASVLVPLENAEAISLKCISQKRYDFVVLQIEKSYLDLEQAKLLQTMHEEGLLLNPADSSKILAPNLSMCEIARNLKAVDKTTCDNKFIARGYINILMGMKLKELLRSKNCSSKMVGLRNFEIHQLETLTDKIKTNPQQQYTIKELCKQTGLSVSKLQIGFKEMHNCTVAVFIRNVRLEKALELLRHTDLNVSEIVYSVGLTSRSYFCRIFKKRFRCSPKTYQQQLRMSNGLAS